MVKTVLCKVYGIGPDGVDLIFSEPDGREGNQIFVKYNEPSSVPGIPRLVFRVYRGDGKFVVVDVGAVSGIGSRREVRQSQEFMFVEGEDFAKDKV